ncbi:MAG TPA: hypothetical protein VGN22_04835 [Pseudonocardia sp.]|jgi:hypothetical protein
MTDDLTPGSRWRSAACTTEIVLVKIPQGTTDLRCGGAPMVAAGEDVVAAELDPAFAEGSLLGKRYADDETGAELLCVKAGDGSLSIEGRLLPVKGAKPLPASD